MIKNNEIHELSASLPKNVRQIGEVQEGHRIYIEDYAYTYLHQYADKKEEQVAFLVGSACLCEDERILLIKGVIQGKFLEGNGSNLEITEESWEHVEEMKRKYFEGEEVVGWVYTQPGYGVILTSFLLKQHELNFPKEGQVLFVLDPVEKEEVFFEYEDEELVQRPGFFVHYEKNPSMHEYMLENKTSEELQIDFKSEDRAVRNYRVKEQEKKEEIYHKKFVNMLFALSGALIIMCIIIGVGLINNLEEMNELKSSFSAVMKDYGTLKNGESSEVSVDVDQEGLSDEAIALGGTSITDNVVDDVDPNIEQSSTEAQISTEAVTSSVETTVLPETYVVQPGDNLIQISYRFYSNKEMVIAIQEMNGIDNENKIYVGQVLSLPQLQ